MLSTRKKAVLRPVPPVTRGKNGQVLPFSKRHHPFLRGLRHIEFGSLDLELPGNINLQYSGPSAGPRGHMRFQDWSSINRLITSGDLGWGEDYSQALWDTDDIAALMHFVAENIESLGIFSNGNAFFRFVRRFKRRLLSNSPTRSRKNVQEHYDLSNDFYRQWLDETMTYSCALFGGNPALPLEKAQKAKYQRILNRLSPRPGDEILEIGCGWGGFIKAAVPYGVHVTGITLSNEQANWVRENLTAEERARAEVRLEDYRKTKGQYDHIVSIGMFEHVGEAYWSTYMKCLYDRLKTGGQAVIQSILVREDLFDFHRAGSGFIREHIFPGGMLPTRKIFETEAAKAGLAVKDVFQFGQDYAITLEKWLARFDQHLPEIIGLGYSNAFIRKWRFYLAYCMAIFRAGCIDVMQVHLEKI